MKPRKLNCPTCGKQIEWLPENRFRPFCSERCRLIDFGAWANERNSIPGPSLPDPEEQTDWQDQD